MAMMAKMRSLAPWFIIGVGGLFVLFMVVSDSNVMQALGGRTNNVGSINGTEISYQEFQKVFDQRLESQKTQTGEDLDEQQMEQLRDQVWDAIIVQKLVNDQVEKYGITVSDQEIRDIILSDNPPDFLKQNFIDSTGQFNRQLYENALFDPRNKDALIQAEQIVRQTRVSEKLQSLLFASITVSDEEVKRNFIEQNTSMNAEYALIEMIQFPDSLINYTDEDLRNYYDAHLDKYKINAQRKLKYVLFPNTPSHEDSAMVRKNLENVKNYLSSDTADFKSAVDIYSSKPYSIDTVSANAISPEVLKLFQNAESGSVIGPAVTPEGYVLYHFLGSIPTSETLVRASHILINNKGSDEANYEEAMKIYDQLKAGADFVQIAKEKSADVSSGRRGGDLGWFGKGRMVPEFEKAAFSGKVGEILKPIKSGYGYHIIKVTGRTNKKFIIEKIVNPITESAATRDERYNAASDFAYLADKNGFTKEAELMNYEIRETTPFLENAVTVPGIGGSKRLVNFAFSNSLNTVSWVHKGSSGYVVAIISEIINEGFRPFEEVETLVKSEVIRQKKFDKARELAAELKAKCGGDLNKIPVLDPRIKVQTTGNFTVNSSIPNLGRDYAFTETALSLELNKISDPVKGIRGYYLIKVIERTPFDSAAFALQKPNIRASLLQQKRNAYFTQWLNNLKEHADIVDNRYQFFGR